MPTERPSHLDSKVETRLPLGCPGERGTSPGTGGPEGRPRRHRHAQVRGFRPRAGPLAQVPGARTARGPDRGRREAPAGQRFTRSPARRRGGQAVFRPGDAHAVQGAFAAVSLGTRDPRPDARCGGPLGAPLREPAHRPGHSRWPLPARRWSRPPQGGSNSRFAQPSWTTLPQCRDVRKDTRAEVAEPCRGDRPRSRDALAASGPPPYCRGPGRGRRHTGSYDNCRRRRP